MNHLTVKVMPKLLAELAVNKCLRIRSDDAVTIFFNPHLTRLAEDIAIRCFKNGADVLLNLWSDRYYLGFLTHLSEESLRQPSIWCRELTRNSTAQFWLGGVYDPAIFRKVPPEKLAANEAGESEAHYPLATERKVRSLGIGLGSVTKPRAKAYRLNFTAWERMIKAASTVDPEALAKRGTEVATRLQSSARVKVVSPNGTELEFSVKGRKPRVDDGIVDEEDIANDALEASIPAGSVQVAIAEDSANGKAVLAVPTPWAGRTIRRLVWTFRDGRVTSFEGDRHALELRRQWESASGDRDRISALTIGLNPMAKLGYTVNHLVQGAVGIAIGGNEDLGGTNKRGFFYSGTVADAALALDGTLLIDRGKLAI